MVLEPAVVLFNVKFTFHEISVSETSTDGRNIALPDIAVLVVESLQSLMDANNVLCAAHVTAISDNVPVVNVALAPIPPDFENGITTSVADPIMSDAAEITTETVELDKADDVNAYHAPE